jgi:molecular chaperone DnaK (HSP70)
VNEPTAASLAYGVDNQNRRTVMVYDLGGGTFDVSVVRIEGDVTEVLSSHGNNRLGGDDFDNKLVDHLLEVFRKQHNVDLRDKNPGAYARLWWAAEAAKKQLSFEPYARVREESLIQIDGRPLHLDVEISRKEYEGMIRGLIDQTIDSVSKALSDAGLLPSALDAVLLVGGSTRTPLVVDLLEKMCGKPPRQELHPDLCVALGAGVLASRLGGHEVERVLVDVSPFSFGPSYLGEREGREYRHCYHPLIRRNTPLPVTRTEEYFTASDFQTGVDLDIYQGDDPDAMKNVHVGNFKIEGLKPVDGPNAVLCRMRLDLDGILHVTAIEKSTGLSRHVAISGATRRRSSEEIVRGRDQLSALFETRARIDEEHEIDPLPPVEETEVDAFGSLNGPEAVGGTEGSESDAGVAVAPSEPAVSQAVQEARALIERCRLRIPTIHADDQEEALNLIEDIETAIAEHDEPALAEAAKAMGEFLFFVEGR